VARAVIFDYYFTLAEPSGADVVGVARSLGCTASADEIEGARRAFVESRPVVPPAFNGAPPEFRTYRDEWVLTGDGIFGRLGMTGGGVAYAAQREQAHAEAELYPDSIAALDNLRAGGLKIGVLSDADAAYLCASITRHGLMFDAVVTSEDVGCYKPHRSCFEVACADLGVESQDTIFVGDTPIADIEGSRRAGLRAVWINRRQLDWPAGLVPPDMVVDSLTEFCALALADEQIGGALKQERT